MEALLDRVVSSDTRHRRVTETATVYLTRLVESKVTASRTTLKDRVRESRQALEGRIRRILFVAVESAERALALAKARQTMEEEEIQERLARLDRQRAEIASVLPWGPFTEAIWRRFVVAARPDPLGS